MKQLKVISNSGGIDLYLLGVPAQYHDKFPSIGAFPQKFNADARDIWLRLLKDEDFVEMAKTFELPAERWNYTIQIFLKWCSDEGISPFESIVDRTDNNRIIDFLLSARLKVIKYLDRIKLLEVVTMYKPYRVYMRKDHGFVVQSYIELRGFGDLSKFEQYLQHRQVGFVRTAGGKWQHVINSNLRMFVKIINSNRAQLWYEISVGSSVYYPGAEKKTVTIKQYNSFIDRTIWLPIVRAHRFRSIKKPSLF